MSRPDIAPFKAIRYNSQKVKLENVVSPPYDVISPALQNELYQKSPFNMVRIDYGKVQEGDQKGNDRYNRSQQSFTEWQNEQVLIRDETPSIYLYEQVYEAKVGDRKETRSRKGFYAAKNLQEFGKGNVLPHEKTLSGPKEDRFLLMQATSANLSPIFSLYMDREKKVAQLLAPFYETEPLYDFENGGIREKLWKLSDPAVISKVQEALADKKFFIADGHHRYETGINYRNSLKAQGDFSEDSSANYILMFFSEMSDPGLIILPTHRVVKNWPNFQAAGFVEKLKTAFDVLETGADSTKLTARLEYHGKSHLVLGIAFKNEWIILTTKPESIASLHPALQKVDTAILHQVILRQILGMKDEEERNPQHLSFVKDNALTLEALQHPETSFVVMLNCPQMDVLEEVAAAGLILPPKTTYFYPKILTGLLIHPIDPRRRVTD
ncbi:MAG: DUF1015 domain-containing protein [Deltaproteobacteria bacterium]|nr:MAG: DUF1015 domain-containing protein [Deltaproteobacteria bacterium]